MSSEAEKYIHELPSALREDLTERERRRLCNAYDAAAASKQAEIDALTSDFAHERRDWIRITELRMAELAELRQDSPCGVDGHLRANWVAAPYEHTCHEHCQHGYCQACAAERERLGRVVKLADLWNSIADKTDDGTDVTACSLRACDFRSRASELRAALDTGEGKANG